MTDGDDGTRLRHAGPDLHPADAADDLTTNTRSAGFPVEDDPDATLELTDDAAGLTDGAATGTDDETPSDGSVGHRPGDVDVMRTAVRGREAEAAEADTSDDTPTPQETHGG